MPTTTRAGRDCSLRHRAKPTIQARLVQIMASFPHRALLTCYLAARALAHLVHHEAADGAGAIRRRRIVYRRGDQHQALAAATASA